MWEEKVSIYSWYAREAFYEYFYLKKAVLIFKILISFEVKLFKRLPVSSGVVSPTLSGLLWGRARKN